MEDGALTAVGSEEKVVPESQVRELEAKIRRLERILGQKTVDIEILKEAVRIGREKKLISRQPWSEWKVSNEAGCTSHGSFKVKPEQSNSCCRKPKDHSIFKV
jgi:hypothetical protein